ncbi:uncharacterized protein G2W53_032369 [Senna tora]|uniref:Retrotransposon gag domain-containing protein n=1 Tax=Senna tora TaxID=362788 RepID=A0A834SXH0_9FABA|nr:uncharacterized protein G2W53_032369 [Senna tora]
MGEDNGRSRKSSKKTDISYGLHGFDQPTLEAKKNVGFIDGSIKPPQDLDKYAEWKSIDSMIKSWIKNFIQEEIADNFVFALTSKALWDILEERFSVNNAPQLYHVQKQTNLVRQGGDSVTVYYNKLHRCWDELDRMKPTSTCTCGKCTCDLSKKIADAVSSTKLLQLLMGLNLIFDVVRTQILNLVPLPSVKKAFHTVVTDEAQRDINLTYSSPVEDNTAMMVKGYQPKNEPSEFKRKEVSKKDKYCDHCKVNGHTKETCFKIHGYLEWWKELKEKRAGKKTVAAHVKDSSVTETPIHQDLDAGSKDLNTAVSFLLKEVQRLGKNKASTSKDEQVNFANLYDFAGAED